MAFLDFLKSRQASPKQAGANRLQVKTGETAKEMYSRQTAKQTTNQKPLEQMPPDQRAKVDAIKERLEKATKHIDRNAQPPAPAPADSMDSRNALRQNMTGQDKAAPALSPTDHQAGQTVQGNARLPSNESPAKPPEKPSVRAPQTVPRPRPSWER